MVRAQSIAALLLLVSAVPISAQQRDRWADVGVLYAHGTRVADYATQLPQRAGDALADVPGVVAPSTPAHATGTGPSVRVTASRLPLSILRAITGHTPEGLALYSGRVCSDDAQMIDGGKIEQAIEARGIAVSTRPLMQIAAQRSRGKALSVLARIGEAATWAAPVVLGLAASGTIQISSGWVGAVGGAGAALKIISEHTTPERSGVYASVGDLGLWLSDMPTLALGKGQCSPRFLFGGSYDARTQTLTVDLQ